MYDTSIELSHDIDLGLAVGAKTKIAPIQNTKSYFSGRNLEMMKLDHKSLIIDVESE